MSYVNEKRDELRDVLKRVAEVKTWPRWFKHLKQEKDKSIRQFCDEHGFNASHICHATKGRRRLQWETINKIKAAMSAENLNYDMCKTKKKKKA